MFWPERAINSRLKISTALWIVTKKNFNHSLIFSKYKRPIILSCEKMYVYIKITVSLFLKPDIITIKHCITS